MTTNPQTVDRIPLAHSVRYVARGLPEVPNQYGPGVLAPSEITLTYRAAPDSGLGRVHAYVAGRIWVDGTELPLLPGGLYGQHYDEGLSNWPEWLAEEARLHDPGRVVSAAPNDGRRDQLVPRAVRPIDIEHDELMARAEAEHQARVAAEQERKTADRAAVVLWAADFAEEVAEKLRTHHEFERSNGALDVMTELRRLAAETQQQEPEPNDPTQCSGEEGFCPEHGFHRHSLKQDAAEAQQQPDTETQPATTADAKPVCICGHPVILHHEDVCLRADCTCADVLEISALPEALEAVLTKRFTELGNQFAEMRVHEQGPDGWPASRLVSPHMVAEALRELLRLGVDEAAAGARQDREA